MYCTIIYISTLFFILHSRRNLMCQHIQNPLFERLSTSIIRIEILDSL